MLRILYFSILLSIFFSCRSDDSGSLAERERPIKPWVFRSVLDEQPRMITIALEKDLCVSYYTQEGALYKAWKGLVNFEGAVYNTAHGPQPTSYGDAYIINTIRSPWLLKNEENSIETQYNYGGHRFVDGHVELMHTLIIKENGQLVAVNEQIESERDENNGLHLVRKFTAKDIPEGHSLEWKGNISSVVDKSQINCDGNLVYLNEQKRGFDGREFLDFDIGLTLNNEKPITLDIRFVEPVLLDPNLDDGFTEDVSSLPLGARLIGKNDCRTCHNVSKSTVGPAYIDIAKKYEHSDENALMLSNKIKKGGTGIWGQQIMTAHPEIPDADIKEMVSYIFSLADFEGELSKKDDNLVVMESAKDIEENDLISGALSRVFPISAKTIKIPSDLDNRKAIMAGIIPNFDNISGGDFIDLEDNFAILSTGYFYAEEEANYDFRLWSDDGSKLYLHGQLIIDHDGPHGTSMKQAQVKLQKGYHPFRLEYYQGAGGKFLSWNYKAQSSDKWEVIPQSMIVHHKDEHKYIGDLSLPMSVVTRIPGDVYPLQDVHPSFDISQARPLDFTPKVGGMDFLSDGRLVVSTWDTQGTVNILDGVSGDDPEAITVKEIASGLAEPLGVTVVDDRIFVVQKQEITELVDTNGDDIIDEYRSFCDDWGVTSNFHEFSFGMTHKDGYLYINLATGIMPGGAGMKNQHPDRGSTLKVSLKDGSVEKMANGLRTPNGIGLGYDNEIFVADNQGDWLPSSKIVHVEKGDWFGSRAVDFEGTADKIEKKPVVWLPQDEIGNSPSTPLGINVGPYQNQMIHGEVTHGGIKRVYVEQIDGQLQGCVFRFIQGIEAGVNRLVWGPDGALYVGGIGNPGNWQQNGKLWYGLQKLKYNGKSTFEMLAVKAHTDGMEIEFTEPLKEGDGWNPEDYELRRWYYLPTADYGGPKLGEKLLKIKSVNISEDRKRVFLETDDLKEDHVIYIRLKNHFVSEQEHSLWGTEAWYTMNNIPENKPGFRSASPQLTAHNTLSESEVKNGWELLFDGKQIDKFHMFNGEGIDNQWTIDDDAIHYNPQRSGNGGDIITNETYENYEFILDWKISNCGNSGIFINAVEDEKYCCAWQTAPEMQVLDNTCHPDSKFITHRAGDLYDMIETSFVTVLPAGKWNKVRIIVKDGDAQFWLNGYEVVNFKMFDSNWSDMIANSKFKDLTDFGKSRVGHFGLQDHDDKVWFRNIKVRRL